MPTDTLYETDIVAWAEQQAASLRDLAGKAAGHANAVDWRNVIEEIESVGRSQLRAAMSKITLLLVHLLKGLSAPESPASRHWRNEARIFQAGARNDYTEAMRRLIDLDARWKAALIEAAAELDNHGDRLARNLPDACPFGIDQLLADDFNVDEAVVFLARLARDGKR